MRVEPENARGAPGAASPVIERAVDETIAQGPTPDVRRGGRGLRARRKLVPYFLLTPGGVFLILFFLVPLGFLGQQSLESGDFAVGYSFSWAWGNYWDAIHQYHAWLVRSLLYAGLATLLAQTGFYLPRDLAARGDFRRAALIS